MVNIFYFFFFFCASRLFTKEYFFVKVKVTGRSTDFLKMLNINFNEILDADISLDEE